MAKRIVEERKRELGSLLEGIIDIGASEGKLLVSGIGLDSRTVQPGELFLACRGSLVDGRNFITDAVRRGAVGIFCEDSLPRREPLEPIDIPIFVVPNLRQHLGTIAARFYDYPSKKITVIGVTGTNGKTTVTHYVAMLLNDLGIPSAVIGTLGFGIPGELNCTINTTPDPVMLQRLLYEFVAKGIKVVAMEVSSQGLAFDRVKGIDFTLGVFTNLTREHLDYHVTMEAYGNAKKSLFTNYHIKHAVINGDDDFGLQLSKDITAQCDVCLYSIRECKFDLPLFRARNIQLQSRITSANLITPHGQLHLTSKLMGDFNISNLLAVVAILVKMGIKEKDFLPLIATLKPIRGRMEYHGGEGKKPLVVIDYAHTPDALEKALLTLQNYCEGSLWCVFGCGGERDRGKRSIMGSIAERYSDHIIITNDNPRYEDQAQIAEDIVQGLLCPWAAEIEYDRSTAIQYAINNAQDNDVILVAGKGHEDYQLVGGRKLVCDDRDIVTTAFRDMVISRDSG